MGLLRSGSLCAASLFWLVSSGCGPTIDAGMEAGTGEAPGAGAGDVMPMPTGAGAGTGGAQTGPSGGIAVPAAISSGGGFFAPAQPSGRLNVVLRPTEVVSAGRDVLVTFGVPFPRGSLRDAAQVRVLDASGQELPAHVDGLTPWRSLSTPAQDGISLRVVRVQLTYRFKTTAPETITVAWGQPRTRDVATVVSPRKGWHAVSGGTFTSADGVQEPDVYALLPPLWLSHAGLAPRMAPFASTVAEARRDPNLAPPTDPAAFYDQATINFFYTTINQDDARVTAANQNLYKTEYDSWLYDRAGTFFHGYLRSGFFVQLREAVRAADFYRRHLYLPGAPGVASRNVGMFDMKVPDGQSWPGGNGAMYSYVAPLALSYWLTGDDSSLSYLPLVCDAETQGEDTRWSATAQGWTERHTAFRLLDNVIAYEVTGEKRYADEVKKGVGDFVWHQDGAGGAFPAGSVIDGALWHDGAQHGDGTGTIASPWMSALTAAAMVRAYLVSEDARIPGFLIRLGRFEKVASHTWPATEHQYDGQGALRFPDYLTAKNGTAAIHNTDDTEHAIDVAATLAWAGYFAELAGTPDATLRAAASDLYKTYQAGVTYYTRPAGPASGKAAYRVAPDRKYGWMYHDSGSYSWAMGTKGTR